MRGALTILIITQNPIGIIPADAGSTTCGRAFAFQSTDHPRGCGEHHASHSFAMIYKGIIPADAGSTRGPLPARNWTPDHPRGCGEHVAGEEPHMLLVGSSPRMRGAHRIVGAGHVYDGIIPADAGSTVSVRSQRALVQDHPRGCGEHASVSTGTVQGFGSSPRMRGAQNEHMADAFKQRIIPADAGSTSIRMAWTRGSQDHPRGCGEHDSRPCSPR